MTYEECVKTVGNTLKERVFEEHKKLATGMCDLWASENGVERKFGRAHLSTSSDEPKRRTFGVPIETSEDMTFISDEKGVDTVQFPIIAITSGPHEYLEDDIEQKVYIAPTILKDNIEATLYGVSINTLGPKWMATADVLKEAKARGLKVPQKRKVA